MIAKSDRIVLIGGSGFIGTAVAKALLENDYQKVTSLSRRAPTNPQTGIEYKSGVDITKPETLLPYLQQADVVINFAGLVSFARKDEAELKKINAAGSQNIARACCNAKNVQRLIHISSTAALGFGKSEINEEHVFDWQDYQHLAYSHSKHLANQEIDACDLKTNIVFPALVLGAGDEANTGMLFRYLLNKNFVLSPPGKNSIIDVRDLAAAIVLILEKAPPNQNYIIAAKSYSFADIFRTIRTIVDQNTHIIVIPRFFSSIVYGVARLLESHIADLHAENVYLGFEERRHDTKKIQSLGFVSQYSLEDSLREYWQGR